jgi:hypothetical protein
MLVWLAWWATWSTRDRKSCLPEINAWSTHQRLGMSTRWNWNRVYFFVLIQTTFPLKCTLCQFCRHARLQRSCKAQECSKLNWLHYHNGKLSSLMGQPDADCTVSQDEGPNHSQAVGLRSLYSHGFGGSYSMDAISLYWSSILSMGKCDDFTDAKVHEFQWSVGQFA